MGADDFAESVRNSDRPPAHLSETLASLSWDRKGDRHADYWYRQAGRARPDVTLEEEWRSLVAEMLALP